MRMSENVISGSFPELLHFFFSWFFYPNVGVAKISFFVLK